MHFDDLYQQIGPSVEGPMPLLILTDGWLEASDTLARVRNAIVHQADLTTIARFDTDQLLDQRARRPMLTVVDGVTQNVDWPELELAVGTDADDKPFLLLHGPEPDFAWRQFGKAVANIVSAIGVTTTYSMGAYPAPMPHTRAIRISSTASDAGMIINREHTTGLITVPVGVQVAITEELERFGVPSHGLYAQVPYYLGSHDWPQAAVAMLETFGELSGLHFDDSQLDAQLHEAVAAVDAMFKDSPSLSEVVTRLEQRYDELRKLESENLPTGDELEEELQQYLRKIDGD
ncbi:MAG: PAC2 family protein [Acidimicrobiaceae bacterium]|nr:PAC2 family protein [Acidimicrobiaceae bacterium]